MAKMTESGLVSIALENWVSDFANPAPGIVPITAASNGYKGGFRLALAKKDIGLAVEAAKMVNSKMVKYWTECLVYF